MTTAGACTTTGGVGIGCEATLPRDGSGGAGIDGGGGDEGNDETSSGLGPARVGASIGGEDGNALAFATVGASSLASENGLAFARVGASSGRNSPDGGSDGGGSGTDTGRGTGGGASRGANAGCFGRTAAISFLISSRRCSRLASLALPAFLSATRATAFEGGIEPRSARSEKPWRAAPCDTTRSGSMLACGSIPK